MEKDGVAFLEKKSLSEIPFGVNVSYFYENRADLFSLISTYISNSVSKNAFCVCIASDDLMVEEIKNLLKEPSMAEYVSKGGIEVAPFRGIFTGEKPFDKGLWENVWKQYLKRAKDHGFEGLSIVYNTSWIEKDDWNEYLRCQDSINKLATGHDVSILFTYALYWYNSVPFFFGALNCSQKTIISDNNNWKAVPSPSLEIPKEGSSLYEKYTLSISSLERMVNEILPWGAKGYTSLRPAKKISITVNNHIEDKKDIAAKRHMSGGLTSTKQHQGTSYADEIPRDLRKKKILDVVKTLSSKKIKGKSASQRLKAKAKKSRIKKRV
ncbi:MAG: MEDS domain-containing protein [Candidatus Omnitrophica bacterium]|nr:MEDS domain-containing protein [Candidatus Omnitrophota bacterium]